MNFHATARLTIVCAWACGAVAAPAPAVESAPQKPLPAWIADLADPKFRVREDASRELWKIGEAALPALKQVATGRDPEQAYRARELIRKIQLHLTPETDPVVVALVESYDTASPEEKVNVFAKLNSKRAWRQILKLYAGETSVDQQARLEQILQQRGSGIEGITGVAVIAARERLLAGDASGAREFLEMAPATAEGLLALADFHRSQGTLTAELERAKTLKGERVAAWRLALYRASGNLEAARDAAKSAGETKIFAVTSALLGDPLPWLNANLVGAGGAPSAYAALAIKRWQGELRPQDLEPLLRTANSKNRSERPAAFHSLFLLGEVSSAEAAYLKYSAEDAFAYFESLERVPEALQALGLKPENPDYAGWLAKRFETLAKNEEENEGSSYATAMQELVMTANFMERRLPEKQWQAVWLKPMADLADKQAERFNELLSILFGDGSSLSGRSQGAPGIAREVALAWAGDDEDRWNDVVKCAFGEEDETNALWQWLAELDPKASRPERLDGMLAICGMGRDPRRLRQRWLELAWEAVNKAPADKREPLLDRMLFFSGVTPDVATHFKVCGLLPEDKFNDVAWGSHVLNLSAANRWDEAAGFFVKQIGILAERKLDPQPHLHAFAAACLRKAGHQAEAAVQDALVEKLALGHDAQRIAEGYAFGCDYARAADWRARAVLQCDPADGRTLVGILETHLNELLEQGNWTQVAALAEVQAQLLSVLEIRSNMAMAQLLIRLNADLGRALANLKNDRAGSIEKLRNCHRMFPSDGSLADNFFPALRKMGLLKEHDEWFKISWERMSAVVAQFPDSDNTCNTAGWLAGRAQRNLEQAKKLLEKALAARPNSSIYLDTMAEIEFARGNRQKALEWSARAVNFMPEDPTIRHQYERFRTSPLPR